jgi:hypothetical protein
MTLTRAGGQEDKPVGSKLASSNNLVEYISAFGIQIRQCVIDIAHKALEHMSNVCQILTFMILAATSFERGGCAHISKCSFAGSKSPAVASLAALGFTTRVE